MAGSMTAKWISDGRQRRSARYQAVHRELQEYAIQKEIASQRPRQRRHKAKAATYKQRGG
jgi:hypothetical protein